MGASYDDTDFCGGRPLKAQDVVDQIRTVVPGFEPSAYLNGTVDPDSMKWLMGIRLADGEETFGHVSPRYMETVQNVSHLFRDRWLSYVTPGFLGLGRSSMALFAPIDGSMRRAMGRYLSASAKSPGHLLRKVRLQTFHDHQAVDFLPDGSANMCDGCPLSRSTTASSTGAAASEDPRSTGRSRRRTTRAGSRRHDRRDLPKLHEPQLPARG
ncbi:MAG: hypothetical protein IPF66_07095 [Holophagales bacterium]|nr:hypothetical protein [Holophagales bacterium]